MKSLGNSLALVTKILTRVEWFKKITLVKHFRLKSFKTNINYLIIIIN